MSSAQETKDRFSPTSTLMFGLNQDYLDQIFMPWKMNKGLLDTNIKPTPFTEVTLTTSQYGANPRRLKWNYDDSRSYGDRISYRFDTVDGEKFIKDILLGKEININIKWFFDGYFLETPSGLTGKYHPHFRSTHIPSRDDALKVTQLFLEMIDFNDLIQSVQKNSGLLTESQHDRKFEDYNLISHNYHFQHPTNRDSKRYSSDLTIKNYQGEFQNLFLRRDII